MLAVYQDFPRQDRTMVYCDQCNSAVLLSIVESLPRRHEALQMHRGYPAMQPISAQLSSVHDYVRALAETHRLALIQGLYST